LPCCSPSRRLSAAGGFGCGRWFSFNERVPPTPFCKLFRIMGFAVFRGKYQFLKKLCA
jgi:hypothetical protein